MLEVTSEVSDDPDFDIPQRVKKVLDAADQDTDFGYCFVVLWYKLNSLGGPCAGWQGE